VLQESKIKPAARSFTSSSAIAERPLHGGLVMAKSRRLELGDNIYGHYRSVFNHCAIFGRQSNQIPWKNAKSGLLCHSRSFVVIKIEVESLYATSY